MPKGKPPTRDLQEAFARRRELKARLPGLEAASAQVGQIQEQRRCKAAEADYITFFWSVTNGSEDS